MSQFKLFREKRFSALFFTQFLGAFNDHLFKNAVVILLAFRTATDGAFSTATLINLSAGVFIVPFFLFSAVAGQLADKYEKSRIIRAVKALEIAIMILAAMGFLMNSTMLLFIVLFLMGTQSTLFGPVKYSILPQHLKAEELLAGNGLMEMGTFAAILVGTILGGLIIAVPDVGTVAISMAVVAVAVAGYLTSLRIPAASSATPNLRIGFNIFFETKKAILLARKERSVFLAILGISWFWFLGALFLAQFPGLTTEVLGGNEQVVTLLLTVFSLGIGIGSVMCDTLSGKQIELGLVPFGALGLTAAVLDFYFALPHLPAQSVAMGARMLLAHGWAFRMLGDLFLVGFFGGLYIVPLYALMQQRSKANERSRIIGADNIINAAFMVGSALAAIVLRRIGFSVPDLFLSMGVATAVITLYCLFLLPEFFIRFIVWILIRTKYRVRVTGLERIPETGGAVIVCNHVSFIDPFVIGAMCRRPVRFVMLNSYFALPVLNRLFRAVKAIPIDTRASNPKILVQAFNQIDSALLSGEIVCIFPEGEITAHGDLNPFKTGIERIIKKTPVPVVPMALRGLWGSFFSRKNGRAMRSIPKRFVRKIELVCGAPLAPEAVTAHVLQTRVRALRGSIA